MAGAFFIFIMLFNFTNSSFRTMSNMQDVLGSSEIGFHVAETDEPQLRCGRTERWKHWKDKKEVNCEKLPTEVNSTLSSRVKKGAILEITFLLLTVLLMTIASKELSAPEWDLEWLITLPMPLSTLLGVRIVERTVVNPIAYIALWPFLFVVAWTSGFHMAAPLIALIFTLLLSLIVATIRTVIDTGFRLALTPPALRNLQAIMSIGSVLIIFPALSPSMNEDSFLFRWAVALPDWFAWLPTGLAVQAMSTTSFTSWLSVNFVLIVQIGLVLAVASYLLSKQLRFGIITTGGRETGLKQHAIQTAKILLKPSGPRRWLSAIQARELKLLGRDRNFLVQTLVLPIVIIGMQVVINSKSNFLGWFTENPERISALAFGASAYALMFSAFQTLNAEGRSLWVLYTLPHSLESILRQNGLLWTVSTLLYPVAIFGIGFTFGGTPGLDALALAAIVLTGIPIYSAIAISLGVFACDPLAQEQQHKVRPDYMYLYMLLASFYTYAIFASGFWQRMALMTLCALLAIALWQKARDHLPYLLDPSATPPYRVSTSDGLIAALMFFVTQGIATVIAVVADIKITGDVLLITFCIAGAFTYFMVRYVFWRTKTAGVPKVFGPNFSRSIGWGVLTGIVASLIGIAYIYCLRHYNLLETEVTKTLVTKEQSTLWLFLLAVVAAPIFEEFIFRGLIFGGLRRSIGLLGSVAASAAIFGIVHPPVSVIPVFFLGAMAALSYSRAGFLIAPMITHAIYNAAVISFSVFAKF